MPVVVTLVGEPNVYRVSSTNKLYGSATHKLTEERASDKRIDDVYF